MPARAVRLNVRAEEGAAVKVSLLDFCNQMLAVHGMVVVVPTFLPQC